MPMLQHMVATGFQGVPHRWKPVGSTGACCRSGRDGTVGSTLDDRCVTGQPHKMQSGTCTKRDEYNTLKLTRDVFIWLNWNVVM